jgi:multidrug efflux pump subunit AcrB
MQAALPADVQLSLAFDQSVIVSRALRNVAVEAALGAALTGLVVLLFLRDPRSAAIVVTTIPLALLASLVALWLTGETINLMTLGGLALAVGILVDEATVAIENIHVHRARGKPLRRAVLEATSETVTPRLLAMLSILAVFVPSFFMVGVTRALFVPLSLAVGFAMLASYLLSNTLVPVLSAWFLREHAAPRRPPSLGRLLERYRRTVRFLIRWRWPVVGAYAAVSAAVLVLLVPALGRDLFPPMEAGQLALRIRAPTGTRVERTEALTKDVLQAIREEAGPENVARTLAFVGIAPSSYPINAIHLWSSGTHEAVMQVALQAGAPFTVPELQERLRAALPRRFPGLSLTFEPGDVVSQILNFGAPAPIEVALSGPDLSANRIFAASVLRELRGVAELRDLGYEQPLDYPTLDLRVDRERAGQLGVTVADVGRSLVAATSSSRFVQPNYWRDPKSGVAYQVQVEMPESSMQSPEAVAAVAVGAGPRPALLDDLAEVRFGSMPGEYDRYNMQRMISISANLAPGWDLGRATAQVSAALVRAGEPPRGVSVQVRGQVPSLQSTTSGLLLGLGIGVVAIFLLLSAYFESLRIGVVALAVFPGVGAGVAAALLATGTSLNVQSFMGAIMALGVSAANAILLVTFAEATRRRGADAAAAAETGATSRIRPVLMTTLAMIAGMIPLALGIGEGGEQTASLARAVIGGLAASTATTLLVLPAVFALVQRWTSTGSRSLLPDDSLPTAPREQ